MSMETTELEIEIKNGKFYILENSADENNIKRFVYNDTKPAISKMKELIKTVNTDKLTLSTVDISTKNWSIAGIPWVIIATGLIRGDIDKDQLDGIAEKIEKPQEASGLKRK